jgi:hypothetical protein
MAFPPKQDHRIPLAEAAAMTKRFRDGVAKGSEIALMFPREVFEQLLKNGKVHGVRCYYARTAADAKPQMIVVGVDADGNDMLADGEIFDRGFPCPPFCGGGNALNS